MDGKKNSGKVALITGATSGIGMETAFALARREFTIHALGTNNKKGNKVLKQLEGINDIGTHRFYQTDLSSMHRVNAFLDLYLRENNTLDVLVLNAGIFPKHVSLSVDDIDLAFSVGYISRYLFAVRLNSLLAKAKSGTVIHVNGSVIGNIKFDNLRKPNYGRMTSVWQNSIAGALLTYNWKNFSKSKVSHVHWNPGIVNTQTVKSQGKIVRLLSKLMGMIEPEQAGEMLAQYISNANSKEKRGDFFIKGQQQPVKSKIKTGTSTFNKLIRFSEDFTGVGINKRHLI